MRKLILLLFMGIFLMSLAGASTNYTLAFDCNAWSPTNTLFWKVASGNPYTPTDPSAYTSTGSNVWNDQSTFDAGFRINNASQPIVLQESANNGISCDDTQRYVGQIITLNESQVFTGTLNTSVLIYRFGTVSNLVVSLIGVNSSDDPDNSVTYYSGTFDASGITTNSAGDWYEIVLDALVGFMIPKINSPLNNAESLVNEQILNVSVLPILANSTNTTFFVYNLTGGGLVNQSTREVTGQVANESILNISLPPGDYVWGVEVCGNDTSNAAVCSASENNSLTVGYLFNSHTFTETVVEFAGETFTLNVTLPSGTTSSDTKFTYNGTTQVLSGVTVGDNKIYTGSITTPDVNANNNVPFSWNLTLTTGTESYEFSVISGTQQVQPLSIDDCAVYTDLLINATLRDEETKAFITPNFSIQNTTIEIEVVLTSLADATQSSTFAQNYTYNNPAQVCVGSGLLNTTTYRMDSTIRYEATEYDSEFYNIQNFSLNNNSIPQNIQLYDLLSADSQEFVVTVKDQNFLPLEGALVSITRKYIADGVFRTVEIPETDSSGQAVAHLVENSVIYTMTVSKEGQLLATFDNVVAVCQNQVIGECNINLNIFSSSVNVGNFVDYNDIRFTSSLNKPSRTITTVFTIPSGATSTILLNATKFDRFGNNTVCSDSLTSSAGTLTCIIPQSFGNITVQADLLKDGRVISTEFYDLTESSADVFGPSRIILVMILIIILPLMFITSSIGAIVAMIFGIVIASILLIIDVGSVFGTASTIMWLVVAAAILIWKLAAGGKN